jgi:phage protein D
MIIPVRKAYAQLLINGQDVWPKLADYVLKLSYTDNLNKADDLQLELDDSNRIFLNNSFPGKGTVKIDCKILAEDWSDYGDSREIDCGDFYIDEPSYTFFPYRITIKGSSLPVTSKLKGSNNTKAWEGKTLQEIAEDILREEDEIDLDWDLQEENPRYKRIDQADEFDLQFLYNQCEDNCFSMKIKRGKLKVFSEEEYEKRPPAFVIEENITPILKGRFQTKTAGTAKEAEVSFLDPETGKLTKIKVTDSSPKLKNARKIKSYDNPKSDPDLLPDPRNPFFDIPVPLGDPPPLIDADYLGSEPGRNKGKGQGLAKKAKKKAKGKLRKANKPRDTAEFELIGFTVPKAGQTAEIKGWGPWAGIYFVESVIHELVPFVTKLKLRRELASQGY